MSKDKKVKDVTKIRRDFSAVVNNLYGDPATVEPPMATGIALRRFAEEAPADAVELINRIFREEQRKALTLATACAEALGGGYDDEKNMQMDERVKRFVLAKRILEGGIQEITTDERDKIKALLVKRFPGSVIAPQCSMLLETEPEEEAAEGEAANNGMPAQEAA